MRALTIISALILAMAAGAFGALMLSGGGTSVGEPYVVVPVKPQPVRSPANAQPSAPALPPPAPAPRTGESSGNVGTPTVAGVNLPVADPAPRSPSVPAAASFPGLSIDPATTVGPRMLPGRANPTGARPGG